MQGYNLFAYCGNNPIKRIDRSGADSEDNDLDVTNDQLKEKESGKSPYPFLSDVPGSNYGGNTYTGSKANLSNYTSSGYSSGNSYTGYKWSSLNSNYSSSYSSSFSSSYSSSTPSMCFVAGTLVHAGNGLVRIEDVRVGDLVWAWDEETGDVALKRVVETYVNETNELVHVFVNGEEIVTTPSHPFYSPVKGWTDAVHLRVGDILVLVNGEYVIVEKVQHEILESPVKVYNFQVEDYHTYFVANTGVLVHNSCSLPIIENDTIGYGNAPKRGANGVTYTKISSDGTNSIMSITTYNQYQMPGQRIDFIGRSHGGIPVPHIHMYSYIEVGGMIYQNGEEILRYWKPR